MAEPEPGDDLEQRAKRLKIRLPKSTIHDYFENSLVEDDKKIARKVRFSLTMIIHDLIVNEFLIGVYL